MLHKHKDTSVHTDKSGAFRELFYGGKPNAQIPSFYGEKAEAGRAPSKFRKFRNMTWLKPCLKFHLSSSPATSSKEMAAYSHHHEPGTP